MPDDSTLYRRFLQLAAVNILSNLMVPLAGLVDVAFLGHLSEIRHLAGVAIATVLFNYIYWTFGFLRMATTGTTAQAAGSSDSDTVLLILLRNTLLALTIGSILLLIQSPLGEIGFRLLSATPEVKAAGQAYYHALIWGAPATLSNFVFIGWFLGREQGGKVLLLSVVGNGANVALDYWFIRQLGWESAGAGLATALSQYLTLLTALALIYREKGFARVPAIAQRIGDRNALKAAFLLNGDILLRTFALVSTFALFTNLSSSLGTLILAANALLLQVVSLAAYFIDGLAFATESLAGSLRGQGANQQLVPLLCLSTGLSVSLGLTFALLFIGFPEPLFRLLTQHEDAIAQIKHYLLWLLPVLGFGSVAYLLDGYFLGLTEGRILRNSMAIAVLVGFAPMATVAWQLQDSHLLWFALSLFMAARALTLGFYVPRTMKNF